jgi:hypothetical protein
MRKIGLILLCLFVLYVAYLYITGKRTTYLVPKGYEGVLLIIGNQKDGIEINKNHAIYDFTKGNIIKLKGDLITGFSPWGYLNYYEVDEKGNKKKIEEISDEAESVEIKDDEIYVWSYYYEIGGCEVRNNGKTHYEALVISKKMNAETFAIDKQQIVNREVCNKKAPN